MPALKSDNVYQRYCDFDKVYNLTYKSLTTGWTVDDARTHLGIHVTLVGDLLQRTEESLRNNNRKGLGLPDPYQGYKHDPYRGPDIPYDEEEKYKAKNKPSPFK